MKNKSSIKRTPEIFTASYMPILAYVLFFFALILRMMLILYNCSRSLKEEIHE